MKIHNTYEHISSIFDGSRFDLERWKEYMDFCVPGAKEICISDMRECIDAGCSWENDFLPVLESVPACPDQCTEAVRAFQTVTEHLEEKIRNAFGKTVHADIVFYVGLCNGAGWATEINGIPAVLLGLEKILELGWTNTEDMTGLIIHELGHLYHAQYGSLHENPGTPSDEFLWQLFTEGVAMAFEQQVMGSKEYYHQDRNGWKSWCDSHAERIRQSFDRDLDTMTRENQRYFGDWVRFEGYGDTGYYLGARFVQYLLESDCFDRVIQYRPAEVRKKYRDFMSIPLQVPNG